MSCMDYILQNETSELGPAPGAALIIPLFYIFRDETACVKLNQVPVDIKLI